MSGFTGKPYCPACDGYHERGGCPAFLQQASTPTMPTQMAIKSVERQALIQRWIDECWTALDELMTVERQPRVHGSVDHVTSALRNLLEIKRLTE